MKPTSISDMENDDRLVLPVSITRQSRSAIEYKTGNGKSRVEHTIRTARVQHVYLGLESMAGSMMQRYVKVPYFTFIILTAP